MATNDIIVKALEKLCRQVERLKKRVLCLESQIKEVHLKANATDEVSDWMQNASTDPDVFDTPFTEEEIYQIRNSIRQ